MKREFRITVDSNSNHAAEELLNTLNKMAQKAEYEHGIDVTVERIETTEKPDVSNAFTDGGQHE